jgi:hypothetical protein
MKDCDRFVLIARQNSLSNQPGFKLPDKGKNMENHIVCPHCKKTISNVAIVEEAVKGEGITTRSMTCDCGEKITYWQITAQLRDQKTTGYRFQNWLRSLLRSQG